MDLAIEGVPVVRAGEEVALSGEHRRGLDQAMRADEVEIELGLPGGDATAELFFCDLSEEYVRFNSEYST
jgi:N-acetylglutamate synthase/N-acetylornithine aminotransferase